MFLVTDPTYGLNRHKNRSNDQSDRTIDRTCGYLYRRYGPLYHFFGHLYQVLQTDTGEFRFLDPIRSVYGKHSRL